MFRRAYFVFPTQQQAANAVLDLRAAGVPEQRMHALAREDIDISSLPPATPKQQHDQVWVVDRLFWNASLAGFLLGLVGSLVAVYSGSSTWAAAMSLLMVASFVFGFYFATRVPHAHQTEVSGALAQGEIVLMVDVPKSRVAEINELVTHRHPEAGLGGIGWTIEALGI